MLEINTNRSMTVESRPFKAPSEGEFGKLFYFCYFLINVFGA